MERSNLTEFLSLEYEKNASFLTFFCFKIKRMAKKRQKKQSSLLVFYIALAGVGLLILFLVLFGQGVREKPIAVSGPRDCGNDLGCLMLAAEACEPSFARASLEAESQGVVFNIGSFIEIKGEGPQGCVLYIRNDKVITGYSDRKISELLSHGEPWDAIETGNKIIAGKYQSIAEEESGYCAFPENSAAKEFISSLSKGEFGESALIQHECDEIFHFFFGIMQPEHELPDICMIFPSEDRIILNEGENRLVEVFGYLGRENEVKWEAKEEGIVSISNTWGERTILTGLSEGLAEIIVSDTSSQDCSRIIFVEVNAE